ncbi:b(0,+)-type amino acid transporter 1-like isoform X1 [Tachysurus ichikawai]
MDNTAKKLQLKSEVGLIGGVSLVAGVMVGSGIFMSPQTVLLNIGSLGGSLVIWAGCGLLAMLASLSYAELGTVILDSGGEYIYILRTSGNFMAFLFAFTSVLIVRPTSMTGLALSFAQNAVAPFYEDCAPPAVVVKSVAAVGLLLLAIVNCLNVRSSMAVTTILTAVKFFALAVISIIGVILLIQGGSGNLQNAFQGTSSSISVTGMAFYQCLWAYDGWSTLNTITEELKHPETVLLNIGSPGASLVIWAGCGLLAMLATLSYAELGTVIRDSGALRSMPVAPFYEDCEPPALVVKSVAASGLVFLAIVNCLNVRSAMAVTTILMAVKFFALAVISIIGVILLIQGGSGNLQNAFQGTSSSISVKRRVI